MKKPKIKPKIMVGILFRGIPQMIYQREAFEVTSGRLDYYRSNAGEKEGWSVQHVLVTAPPKRRKRKEHKIIRGMKEAIQCARNRHAK